MIDQDIKRSLGQMVKGVQVVGATHDGVSRAYTSHWVCQVSFEEPVVMASVSPKHDTHPLIEASGLFSVSILAGDQVAEGQYFSYPGHRFRYAAPEYVELVDGLPVVPGAIAWLRCEVFDRVRSLEGGRYGRPGEDLDHDLYFARVTRTGEGRLQAPALLYSSRQGWRISGARARPPGTSIRDELLARVDRPHPPAPTGAPGSEPC
jgi:flavin reductase (DIM6/NTAB) family NADH-FMN oxidoreductase RutF